MLKQPAIADTNTEQEKPSSGAILRVGDTLVVRGLAVLDFKTMTASYNMTITAADWKLRWDIEKQELQVSQVRPQSCLVWHRVFAHAYLNQAVSDEYKAWLASKILEAQGDEG